jgi:phosphoglycerate kinase
MRKKSVKDIEVSGRRVLVRVDFNVPLDDSGRVADDTRIRASLPTLRYLLDEGASLVLMSHLGRPKGNVVESLRLAPVGARLSDLLGVEVRKIDAVVGDEADEACSELAPGDVLLLENLRFEPGEEGNDPEFAAALARMGEVFVNDAFGAAHRAHASVVGVAEHLPSVAGLLMQKEIEALQGLLLEPARPFVAVLGGSKISDKLKVIRRFQEMVDVLLIGGGMCFTMLKAEGMEIGRSLSEEELMGEVEEIMAGAAEKRADILLPVDIVAASGFKEDAEHRVVASSQIPPAWMGLDIGPRTIKEFREAIAVAETIFWNGPMGVFEWERFGEGTHAVAEAIAGSSAVTVAGGGDTVAAIEKYGLQEGFTHVSTGGGAAMEFLEGNTLPGLAVLQDEGA